ncbi:MAG: CBS domain-containing protein [Clostridia bacterium]|nr:CBS domain-containing protein [Clostridia bacterium]
MEPREGLRSEQFLKLYRMLEGLLEKRYDGKRLSSGSVVMEYLRDDDSAPCRTELDMCREIRNLLSHNADEAGEPVVEPSAAVVRTLREIVDYVQRPRLALEYGTPGEKILFAHPNDAALGVMRHMMRMGYSHVPVRDRTGLVGVFSAASLMRYVGDRGFEGLRDSLKIGELKNALDFDDARSEKYAFFDRSVTLTTVREAFDKRRERNSRLAVAFITEDGTQNSGVLAMLTSWDVLKDAQ